MKSYPRSTGGKAPGRWVRLTIDGRPAAKFTCPLCAFTATLGDGTHEIARDGTVSPSVVCGNEACTFHEFIRLKGWEG